MVGNPDSLPEMGSSPAAPGEVLRTHAGLVPCKPQPAPCENQRSGAEQRSRKAEQPTTVRKAINKL